MKINYTFKTEIICGLVVLEFNPFEKLEMSLSLGRRLMACQARPGQATKTNSPLRSYSRQAKVRLGLVAGQARPKKSGLSTALLVTK